MISQLLENIKSSLKSNSKRPDNQDSVSLELLNVSQVVSTITAASRKPVILRKEGQFVITQKIENNEKHLVFEWIPMEGYLSRFSKRKISSDLSDSSPQLEAIEALDSYTTNRVANFWQIVRTSTKWLKSIQIRWTDWANDVGYLVLKDFDSFIKKFKFQEGGISKINMILNSYKYRSKYDKNESFKLTYVINNIDDFFESVIYLQDLNNQKPDEEPRFVDVQSYESFFNEHGQMEDIFNFKRVRN
ncbi:hypothetical protein RF11_02854 [Thelohanellus kitauei]|uniref:Uncharacterized protein n=1 Tax=Thelohanellus kitauei TaxID=669202 RepID=A0A0C2M6T4_THEKT|nr:hypothetical protein RF11_02854 [Thelohanellus kitauei]